jgi:hypothetical protein
VFAQFLQIDHCAQRATDQALDFLCPSALLAFGRFALAAGVSGAGQHRIFAGDPAFAFAAQPGGKAIFHAGGAQHPRIAKRYEHGPFRVFSEAGFDGNGAHFVGRTAGRSHEISFC